MENMKRKISGLFAETFQAKNVIMSFVTVVLFSALALTALGVILVILWYVFQFLLFCLVALGALFGIVWLGVFCAAFVLALFVLFYILGSRLPYIERAFYATALYRQVRNRKEKEPSEVHHIKVE